MRTVQPWSAALQLAQGAFCFLRLSPTVRPHRHFSSAHKFVDRAVVEAYGGAGAGNMLRVVAAERRAQAAAGA
jgi:hypothetical protein